MKKTIIEEYDSNGKLIKKTTIEEDSVIQNGLYNPYSPYNPIAKPTITNVPTTGVIDLHGIRCHRSHFQRRIKWKF